jgi:hypothetical protein
MKLPSHATNKEQIKELKEIAEKHDGVLKPINVIAFAKNPETALHKAFEWDNTIAGQFWRLEQARKLIQFSIEIKKIKNKDIAVRVFLSPKPNEKFNVKGDGGYKLVTNLLKSKMGREEILQTALDELESFRKKYHWLSELVGVFSAIDETKNRIEEQRSQKLKSREELIKNIVKKHQDD